MAYRPHRDPMAIIHPTCAPVVRLLALFRFTPRIAGGGAACLRLLLGALVAFLRDCSPARAVHRLGAEPRPDLFTLPDELLRNAMMLVVAMVAVVPMVPTVPVVPMVLKLVTAHSKFRGPQIVVRQAVVSRFGRDAGSGLQECSGLAAIGALNDDGQEQASHQSPPHCGRRDTEAESRNA
eukprot:CAMPEP_0176005224 /NCGR_PEP_ID=MMETSP0120_2-20121206/2096_1 /TAXON_ID=160619 /ORGANISM="Kryptoperidinium foliaceum, Strain CCMP 1326" /LENGTH=179 /DNA_ID=CAMNT_0017337925 /DNA_START=384 /DNA_END=920 /DNA_ORIENTATION=-